MSDKICAQCGERNSPDAEFCIACLSFLPWSSDEPSQASTPSAGAQRPAGSTPVQTADGTSVLRAVGPVGPTPVRPAGPTPVRPAGPQPWTPGAPGSGTPPQTRPPFAGPPQTSPQGPRTGPHTPHFGATQAPPTGPHFGATQAPPTGPHPPTTGPHFANTQGPRTGPQGQRTAPQAPPTGPQPFRQAQPPPVGPDVSQVLRATVEPAGGEIRPAAGDLSLAVHILNASPIVDAFVVEAQQPPPWLQVSSAELRLMPDANDISRVSLRVAPGMLPPAGRFRLWLHVRSVANPSVRVPLPVDLSVPALEAPMTLKLEPAVVRVRGTDPGAFVAVIDNSAGNQVRRVVLAGEDPERKVRFRFSPPSVDVPPGGTAHVRLTVEAPTPEPGSELSRQITVLIPDPTRPVRTTGTFVQSAAPAPVDVPFEVELTPSLVRIRDIGSASLRVVIDNKQGARARRVTLTGADPEGVLRFSFWPHVVEVGRGVESVAELRIDLRPPAPGAEATHPFTVTGWDGSKEVSAAGSVVASTSPPPVDRPMNVRLEPSVLRVRDAVSSETMLVVDNRGGARVRLVQFGGHDPERVLGFAFSPERLELAPGQSAGVRVLVSAPRVPAGQQTTRPFTLVASDGEADVEAPGSLVQEFTDYRPLWRRTLTILGSLLMGIAAFLPWNVGAAVAIPSDVGVEVGSDITGLEWGLPAVDSVATASGNPLFLPDLPNALDPVVSAGSILLLLAAVTLLGLMGSTGRLTRLASLVAAVLLAGFLIAASLTDDTGSVGPGAVLAFAGCVVAFIGGALARARATR